MQPAPRRLLQQRLVQQHLLGPPCARSEDVIESLLAVQSQDYAGAKWAVAQRTLGGTDAAVQEAFREGRILRTHVLRPTWHFVAPADIRWLLELSAPRVHAANAYYYRQQGISAAVVERSSARIARALRGGQHLTRAELARALGEGGRVPAGIHLICLLMHAELDGLICSGAMRGKQQTYALLEERAPGGRTLKRDEALAELARRYVSGHGPAQAQDLAWWSGLTLTEAQRGLDASRDRLERTVIGDKTYWFTALTPMRRPRASVHLLPNYDELLVAFKDRSLLLDPLIEGLASVPWTNVVLVDGRIVGSWRRTLGKREVSVVAELLRPLSAAELEALDLAAARYARSLGLSLRLQTTEIEPPRRRGRQAQIES